MSIVRDLGVLVTKRREVNLKDYVELVKQAANGEVQADDDLLDAIERIGKTAHDFQKDVETLQSRREAVKSLERAEAMKKEQAIADEAERKVNEECAKFEEEYRKKKEELNRKKYNVTNQASDVHYRRRRLIADSLDHLNATVSLELLEEIASVQAELDQTQESLRAVNNLIYQDGNRDGLQLQKYCEEIGFDRYSDCRPKWADREKRRDELQALIPQLEAKLADLEKQKLDPERMRWTEGVE